MATRRRLLLVSAVVAVTAIAGYLAISPWASWHYISREVAGLIQEGMTQAEVRSILGPAHENSEPSCEKSTQVILGGSMQVNLDEFNELHSWTGDEIQLYVIFDQSEKVRHVFSAVSGPGHQGESYLAKFRRWLGL